MKKLTAILIVTALLIPGLAHSAKKKAHEKIKFPELNKPLLPEIQKGITDNNIKLRLIKDNRLPLVRLSMRIKGGAIYDPSDKVSLANITAQLLRIGGTENKKPAEVDRLLDEKGIDLTFTANTNYFSVNMSCLEENFAEAVELLAEILKEPAFNAEKLEEIKTQLASTISRRNDMPDPINQREFDRLIYGNGSPFAAVLEYEHLDNITPDDLKNVYKRFFSPENLLVGIVGPVELNESRTLFQKHLGDWENKSNIPAYPEVKPIKHNFKVAFAEKDSLNQSYLSIGHLGVKFNLENHARFSVFNSIFSQGFSSRLMHRVRTKMGLTYGIGGGIITNYMYPGKTFFSTFTKMKSTIKAINAILDEIKLIRKEKVTAQELKDAQDYFLNSQVFVKSTTDNIMGNELNREFYNLPPGYIEKLMKEIKEVTADDILKIAQDYLAPEKMVIFIVGKEKDIEGKLSDLGKVKKIDISIKQPALKEKIPAATPESLEKGSAIVKKLLQEKYKGYKKLKTRKTEMDMKMEMMGQKMSMTMKNFQVFPDKTFNEMTIMGMKITSIISGNRGMVNQMGQEKEMSADQLQEGKFYSDYRIFNFPQEYQFQYLKEEETEGKKYTVLYIHNEQKKWKKIFVNQETGFIEIEERLSNIPGQSGVMRTVLSDIKVIKGIPVAYSSIGFLKGKKIMEAAIKSVEINTKIDNSLFILKKKK